MIEHYCHCRRWIHKFGICKYFLSGNDILNFLLARFILLMQISNLVAGWLKKWRSWCADNAIRQIVVLSFAKSEFSSPWFDFSVLLLIQSVNTHWTYHRTQVVCPPKTKLFLMCPEKFARRLWFCVRILWWKTSNYHR
jgi:hypothetical protein